MGVNDFHESRILDALLIYDDPRRPTWICSSGAAEAVFPGTSSKKAA